jgi:hypothetical protein
VGAGRGPPARCQVGLVRIPAHNLRVTCARGAGGGWAWTACAMPGVTCAPPCVQFSRDVCTIRAGQVGAGRGPPVHAAHEPPFYPTGAEDGAGIDLKY